MDEYTERTKAWLDKRFKSTDEQGVYKSHAPIYGFRGEALSLGLYKNYYAILKEIERLTAEYRLDTFLDAGCAEGFTAHLVKNIFGFKAFVIDLSGEAVERAKGIYDLPGWSADVQSLDNIAANSFDLVLCSETIEHVPCPEKAFLELMRIARKVLIVTVPAARDRKEKASYVPPEGPHTHLNIFTREELERFLPAGEIKGISPRWKSRIENLLTSDAPVKFNNKSWHLIGGYRAVRVLIFLVRKFYGVKMAKILIKADYWLCALLPKVSVNTYLAVFKKVSPELNNHPKRSKDILDLMLKESKVAPVFLTVKDFHNYD